VGVFFVQTKIMILEKNITHSFSCLFNHLGRYWKKIIFPFKPKPFGTIFRKIFFIVITLTFRMHAKEILIVDDDPIVLTLCKKLLEKNGFSVQTTESATLALEKAGQENFDLIILDINMPGISGFDLLNYIRSFGNETPIIFLSGNDVEWTKTESIKIGAARFVSKEKEFDKLPEIVREILG
jgi:CheY-like chemotaxis protein